jgi:hypothetical protein
MTINKIIFMGRNNDRNIKIHNDKLHKAQETRPSKQSGKEN